MVTRAVSCPLVPPGVRLTSGRCSESNSGRIRSRNYTGIALCLKQIFQRAHPPAILLHEELPIGQLKTNRRPQLFRGHAKLKTRSTWAAAVAPAVRRRWWGSCCGCAGAGGLRPCWGGGLVVAFFYLFSNSSVSRLTSTCCFSISNGLPLPGGAPAGWRLWGFFTGKL